MGREQGRRWIATQRRGAMYVCQGTRLIFGMLTLQPQGEGVSPLPEVLDAVLHLLHHAHSCNSPDAPLKSQAAFNTLTAFNTTCKSSGLNFALRTSFAKTAACALVTCSDRSPHEPMAKSLDDFSSLCAVASPFASKSSWVVCSSDRCGARCGRKMVNGDVSRNSVGVRRRGKAV